MLQSRGVEVDIQAPIAWEGSTLSSTRIRAAIREGQIDQACNMMGRDFVLDLGAAHVRRAHTTMRVEKISLSQVLPPPGSYLVDIETPAQSFPTGILIDEEEIRWEQSEEQSVNAIRFTETREEGDKDAHEREEARDH
jgi:FAD synthase